MVPFCTIVFCCIKPGGNLLIIVEEVRLNFGSTSALLCFSFIYEILLFKKKDFLHILYHTIILNDPTASRSIDLSPFNVLLFLHIFIFIIIFEIIFRWRFLDLFLLLCISFLSFICPRTAFIVLLKVKLYQSKHC